MAKLQLPRKDVPEIVYVFTHDNFELLIILRLFEYCFFFNPKTHRSFDVALLRSAPQEGVGGNGACRCQQEQLLAMAALILLIGAKFLWVMRDLSR